MFKATMVAAFADLFDEDASSMDLVHLSLLPNILFSIAITIGCIDT